MTERANPLLEPWDAPYGLPPFAAIRPAHFPDAFAAAWASHRAEIGRIVADPRPPDFDNTIAAFDASGRMLAAIESLFDLLCGSASDAALQEIEMALAAPIAAHHNAIHLDAALFARIEAVHLLRHEAALDDEQRRLVERVHLDFVRAGARLPADLRTRQAAIGEELAELMARFGQNVMADEEAGAVALRGAEALDGLPASVRDAARQCAVERDPAGAAADPSLHLVALSQSTVVPFLEHSRRRDLREAVWRAWTSRGERDGPHDNRPIARAILALRQEQARALGHASYAEHAIGDSMAGAPERVRALLEKVWAPARERAGEELRELQALARELGEPDDVQPWDWRWLAEQLRQRRHAIDESAIKPYFSLDRVVEAAFDCAGRLFGLRFEARPDWPAWHPDVRVYEVFVDPPKAAATRPVGLFLQDNFARSGKRSGAWMNALRWQSRRGPGGPVLPIVGNHNNFARPAAGAPALLSFEDAATLFHEFGHGLHALLSDVGYDGLSGTQVLRDFVELPSQLLEHWIERPEVLRRHARHVETGEPIPDALIERVRAARRFNQGFETVRYLASALVDLDAHSRADAEGLDIVAFERERLAALGAPPACGLNHRLPHFQHLFSGDGYAAGYYVYLWAEVLEADAFQAFVETDDVFDASVAARLRRHVFEVGNAVDPGETFRRFRGRDPQVEPMLRQRGLMPA